MHRVRLLSVETLWRLVMQNVESYCLLATAEQVETWPAKEPWPSICPYCATGLAQRPFDTTVVTNAYRQRSVDFCQHCGWWQFSEDWDDCNTGHTTYFCSIMQSFDLAAATVPIDVLTMELPKWISHIGDLHPRRMEDLIQRMLAGAWECDVEHVGYSKDGGIDLIALKGDRPVAIQVKRRQSAIQNEGVSPVREFLAAALLKGHRRLLYVTTAPGFTKGSRDAALQSTEVGLTESFELMSMNGIRSLLPLTPNCRPWDYAVARANRQEIRVPKIPNPHRQVKSDALNIRED